MIALLRRSFGRMWRQLAAVAAVLACFQLALVAAATSIAADGGGTSLARLVPGFLQQSVGLALLSFAGMTTIGFFHALIVIILVQFAVYLASEPAADVESGIVDLLLARPLSRHLLVSRTLAVMATAVVALAATMSLALWIGLWWLAPSQTWPSVRTILTMGAHLILVAWSFGALALAVSGHARRRAEAAGPVAVVAMAAYLIDFLATMWTPAAGAARLSPFHYFHGGDILAGTANTVQDVIILTTITAAGVVLAYATFSTRDL